MKTERASSLFYRVLMHYSVSPKKKIDFAVIHLKKSFYPKKKTTNTPNVPQDAPGISTI